MMRCMIINLEKASLAPLHRQYIHSSHMRSISLLIYYEIAVPNLEIIFVFLYILSQLIGIIFEFPLNVGLIGRNYLSAILSVL